MLSYLYTYIHYHYPVKSKLGRILKQSRTPYVKLDDIFRFQFFHFFFFLSTTGRLILHSGGCDGERVKRVQHKTGNDKPIII